MTEFEALPAHMPENRSEIRGSVPPSRAFVRASCFASSGRIIRLVLAAGVVGLATAASQSPFSAAQTPPSKGSPSVRAPSSWDATVAPKADAGLASATAVDMRVEGRRTIFTLQLSRQIDFQLYTLDQPYRVILDAGHVHFNLPASADLVGRGVVAAYRYGLLAPGQSRVVIDTTGPVAPPVASWRPAADGTHLLVIALEPTDAAAFKRTPLPQFPPAGSAPAPHAATAVPAKPSQRRVVVIDPGHGGIDPGAVGILEPQAVEKDIVLAVAMQLRQLLAEGSRYDVVLTRSGDVFVSLDQRVKISLQHHADLFVSIHADSIGATDVAANVRGATVYTLSENASDERARLLAEKENASDLLAGFDVPNEAGSDQVRSILLDLLKRESANFSIDFRGLLVRHMRRQVKLVRDPQRSAAFRVLRQTHAPSVLIELGYMSHAEDVRLLRSADWQKRVASSIAAAVNEYFSRPIAKRR